MDTDFTDLFHRHAAATLTPATISHSWPVWLNLCSGWDEHPGLSREPSGWPPSRSYRFVFVKLLIKTDIKVVSVSCPRVIREVIHLTHTVSWRSLQNSIFFLMPKSEDCTADCVFGAWENYGTGHCVIEDRPWCRAQSWWSGREDRRRVFFFANFILGRRKSMVNFVFWMYFSFKYGTDRGHNKHALSLYNCRITWLKLVSIHKVLLGVADQYSCHQKLSSVYRFLSDNNLTTFPANTFHGLPQLKRL